MPRGRKRQIVHIANDETHFARTFSVKTSLSSIAYRQDPATGHYDVRPLLRDVLLYCNKLRVLITLVAKHHIYAHLEAHNGVLAFNPDHNYYSRVRTMVVKGQLSNGPKRPAPAYAEELRQSRDVVLAQIPCPVYDGCLSKTAVTKFMTYLVKQLAENHSTHVDTHAYAALLNWRNNQIVAHLTPEEYEDRRGRKSHLKRYRTHLEELLPELAQNFATKYEELKVLKTTAEKTTFFYRLRHDIDVLAQVTDRSMKLMAVMPEASIRMSTIRIDSAIIAVMLKSIEPNYPATWTELAKESPLTAWGAFFKLNKIQKLRRQATFSLSIQTNGVAVIVQFQQEVPNVRKPPLSKKRRLNPGVNQPRQPKPIIGPGLYEAFDTIETLPPGLVAIDPGVRRLITAVQLSAPTEAPLIITQNEYRDQSLLNYNLRKVGCKSTWYRQRIQPILSAMSVFPSRKSVSEFTQYLNGLAQVWEQWWAAKSPLRHRKREFFIWRRREQWMAKTVNRIKSYASKQQNVATPMVLFGDGGANGQFGKLRGGGVKGPVVELRKRLAEKVAVITCSEYRTSKLCLECGRRARFYRHGVSYCAQRNHHRMLNRDVTAAFAIGARFLAFRSNQDLGPWQQGSNLDDFEDVNTLVLRQALRAYNSSD